MGFGARGTTLAAWGLVRSDHGAEALVILLNADGGMWDTKPVHSISSAICKPQAGGYQALTFDESGNPLIAITERGPDGVKTAFAVKVSREGRIAKNTIATNVGAPRHIAMAVGPNGQVALYSGNWEVDARSGVQAETILQDVDGFTRRPVSPPSNFPGPLAFDKDGRLHQAVVIAISAEGNEVRELHYIVRTIEGEWSEEIVDTTAVPGAPMGSRVLCPMSAHISLALKPNGTPVIIGNSSSNTATRYLVIYEQEGSAWRKVEIDLLPIVESFGLINVDSGSMKQLLFDEEGGAHVALFSSAGRSAEILYFAFDLQWSVMEQRAFPAQEFFGMGIDRRGTIHLAMR